MKTLREMEALLDRHRDGLMELVRIYLGVALFVRGMVFWAYEGDDPLFGYHQDIHSLFAQAAFAHYIIGAHLAGGLLMAIGLLTRIAALIQIPILFVAVTFLHAREGLFAAGQNLELSALVLFLLVLILIQGSGRWSVDAWLAKSRSEKTGEH
jgi:putative oxidoreductase